MKRLILSFWQRAGASLHNRPTSGLGLAMLIGLSGPNIARAAAPDLASAAAPMVILNFADLHVTGPDSMEEFKQVIAFANAAIHPVLTFVAGDTPHNGTLAEYQAYKQVRDTLRGPVVDAPGDHEAKSGGLEHYRKVLGDLTYSFPLGARWQVVGLNSMGVDDAQLAWARQELTDAKAKNRVGLIFIHHNFAGLKDRSVQDKLNTLVKDTGVKLVLAGHTHNNTVINDSAGLQITTTSIKEPRGSDPKGWALLTLDEGRLAWHFIPLGQQPVVAVCSPISKLMTTGPEGVVRGQTAFRVKAFDPAGIKSVTATVDGGAVIALTKGKDDLWLAPWDSKTVPDGEHKLKVEAVNADGKTASEEILILVNQSGAYTPVPATVSDGKAGGAGKAPKDGKAPKGGPAPKGGKGKKQPVALDQLPTPVRAALERQAGKAEFSKLEQESKDGRDLFTAKWGPKETERELRLAADGALVDSRELVGFDTLPAAVREAMTKARPGLKNPEIKKLTAYADSKPSVTYEVRGDVDGEKQPPLKVSADGTVSEAKGGKAK